jgi:hypothetical protein
MKAQYKLFRSLFVLVIILVIAACENDDEMIPPAEEKIVEGPGITADTFETYEGEIGILINARDIARKGYKPMQAVVNVGASSGDISQTIPLNEFSYMGQLKIPLESLSEAAKEELIAGVPVTVTLQDKTGTPILSNVSMGSVSFLANPPPQNVSANDLQETAEAATINLNESTDYYLQKVEADGAVLNMSMRWNQNPLYGNVMTVSTNNTFAGDQPDHVFNFVPVPGEKNTFYIKLQATQHYLQNTATVTIDGGLVYFHAAPKNSLITTLDGLSAAMRETFKFKLEKKADGVYVMKNYEGKLIKEATGIGLSITHSSGEDVYWRIVAKDIAWTVQPIASSIITPVLPAAETGFSFNSTLKNCGQGSLEQTVGAEFSEERSNTIGWAESISINNTNSQSVSSTIGVEFDATFFGFGATYSASLTSEFQWSQSVTSETSSHESETITKTENYFSTRTITVPAGSSSLVYDAYQFYENVRVDYVQRLRLSGVDEDGNPLTGDAIKSIFQFTRFNGVINTVEENSVVFTLRGFTVLDKFIETQSSVEDVPANCN